MRIFFSAVVFAEEVMFAVWGDEHAPVSTASPKMTHDNTKIDLVLEFILINSEFSGEMTRYAR